MASVARQSMTMNTPHPASPRLCLRPPLPAGSPGTPLDGGWWARSADPVAELPGLILALQAAGPADARHAVTRVLLAADGWESRPQRLRVDGADGTRIVRLGWFDGRPAGLLTAISAAGRVDLLTVPATANRTRALAAITTAAREDNRLDAPALLALLTPLPGAPEAEDDAVHDVWESEGGRLAKAPGAVATLARHPGHTVVALHGELDIATAPELRERLLSVLHPDTGLLVLDLGDMEFCDATGLGVFAGTHKRASALGVTLRLAAPRPLLMDLLEITGLDRRLLVHGSLDEALAAHLTASQPAPALRTAPRVPAPVSRLSARGPIAL